MVGVRTSIEPPTAPPAAQHTPHQPPGKPAGQRPLHDLAGSLGVDPVTGKDLYLRESTRDEKKVPEIRSRLLAKVDQQRSAATNATLAYTIDAWLSVHEVDETTLGNYRSYVERTIKPALGNVPISKLKAQTLELFYAQLRKCSERCNGKPYIEHRSAGPHDCRTVRHRRKPGRPSARSVAEHDCEVAGCTVVEMRTPRVQAVLAVD